MKVTVVGANGQIGKHLTQFLADSNDFTARAILRNEEQKPAFDEMGAETVVADLEGSVDDIERAIEGSDAVVFTAGSGGKTGADKTLLVDLDGAVKTMEATEKAGIDRFIIVSAHQAHHRENWNPKIRHYYAAKHYADRFLEQTSLNYTIIRPGGLRNEPGTGKISAGENLTRGSIAREDVAKTVLSSIKEEKTFKRGFDLTSGDTPIADALNNLEYPAF